MLASALAIPPAQQKLPMEWPYDAPVTMEKRRVFGRGTLVYHPGKHLEVQGRLANQPRPLALSVSAISSHPMCACKPLISMSAIAPINQRQPLPLNTFPERCSLYDLLTAFHVQ